MSETPPPLPADERRRATATTEGFIFQWWLSVLAWLELGDGEALYLESSEDFEVTTPVAAKTVQAKGGVSRTLTLRSEEVIAALNHYWELTTHDRRAVRFVLLAQAEAGVEQGAPFGAAIPGLRQWQEVTESRQPEAAGRLQRFLREDVLVAAKLSPALQQFVRTASSADFCERLVEPITFDLGRETTGTVQQLVRDRLVVLCAERHGAAVAEAERVSAVLFTSVVQLAANKERVPLTRAQLLRVLEEQIVKQRERVGLALPPAMAAGLLDPTGQVLWEAVSEELKLPPLPAQVLARPELVGKLSDLLTARSVLVLSGSTGMGKTTLAKQVAATGSWWWLDLQGCPPLAAQLAFRHVLAIADHHRGSPINLVLDGFAPEGLPAAALSTLRGVAWLLRNRGGRVLITTQRPLTATEIAGFGWSEVAAATAPRLESAEIARFATDLGCPDPKLAALWATAVQVHSQGHPQLVHAACLWLQRNAWPQFDGQTFRDSGATVETERAQARSLVARLSGDELELLTRLSVLGHTFRRDHALALAEKLQPLSGAGFRFDALLGPWIEPGGAVDYYRLSPMLSNAAATVTSARRAELENACALARLENTPVYAQDAAHALQHAIAGKDVRLAASVAAKFLLTPHRQRAQVYGALLWLTWISEAELAQVFSSHEIQAAFIHLLRFQIVAELLPTQVAPFVVAAEKALTHLPAEVAANMRFTLLSEALMSCTKYLPARDVLRYLEEAATLALQQPAEDVARWFPRAMLPPALRTVAADEHARMCLTGLMLGHVEGRDFLDELLAALDDLPEERRRSMIRALAAWPTLFLLPWDKVWVAEGEKAVPDWESLLAWLASAGATATRWQSEEFAVAAARSASVICNEYLDDADRAERLLLGVEAAMPGYASALLDQRAKIAAQRQQLAEALALVRQALPRWDDSDYGAHGRMLALQRAGTWAGKLERWKEAAEFFTEGAAWAKRGRQLVAQAGLETDAGFTYWQANEKPAGLAAFARALEFCDKMQPPTEDLATFQFQKLLGHILLSLAMSGRRSPHTPPQAPVVPGMASTPALNEKVKTLPPPSLTACKVFVAMLEHNHQLGDAYWNRYRQDGLNSRSMATRTFALELAVRKAVRRGACTELPALAAQQASVLAVGRTLMANSNLGEQVRGSEDADFPPVSCPFDDQMCGERMFLPALVSVAAQQGDLVAALLELEAHATESPFPEALRAWAQRARAVVTAPESEVLKISRGAPLDSDRILASLALLGQARLAPDALWGALYVTMTSLNSMYWGADVLRTLDDFAGRRWRQAAENRFAFRNPTLWLPGLKSLCGEAVTGNRRLAALLLAALPALDLRLDQAISQQLQQTRDGTLDTGWQKLAPRLA